MAKQALLNRRPLLLASIAAALAYYLFKDGALGEIWLALIKGAAVGLLALYAWLSFPAPSSRWLAAFLGIYALGDMAIIFSFEFGGTLFFLGHLVALGFYLRFPRTFLGPSQKMLAVVLFLLVPGICWLLSGSWHAGLYGIGLGAMAASAWVSRFPRFRVGLGAILFVVSDLLIFAAMGPMAQRSPWLVTADQWLVWPIYYSGQFLICVGVIQRLRRELLA